MPAAAKTSRPRARARAGVRTPRRAYNKPMVEHVILLHGVWMRGLTLFSLARRLRAAGYSVDVFDYASVFGDANATCERLRTRMREAGADRVHLVGHSLGGVVALEATRRARDLPRGHVVCLGPPLKGSSVARLLAHFPGGRWVLGANHNVLVSGVERWDGSRPVGVVAGRMPFGLGISLCALLKAPHDGTVSVEETRLAGLSDHCTVDATHTGLLFSSDVVDLTIGFLRNGRFALPR
ncbi:MAG TPA: alpha/beta fold hydrolase [Rhodanobacteraceae bacterium]|nr:alpha/beta fold hydrolase [Rhodanobacteraceae bacterium]